MIYFKTRKLDSINDLYTVFNKKEFKSPFRSTIPLISLFKQNQNLHLNIDELKNVPVVKYIFEHETKVQKGRGLPSCTDLMVEYENHCLVIESKRTEPSYETVEKWLKNIPNRYLVLEGWIEILNSNLELNIQVVDVLNLPYQLVHRVASAFFSGKKPLVLYIGFDLDSKKEQYYFDSLTKFSNILEQKVDLYFNCYSIEKFDEQNELEKCWNSGNRDLSARIIYGLSKNILMNLTQISARKITTSPAPQSIPKNI
jgi:hypothetical protein